jgi:hypothetical protein
VELNIEHCYWHPVCDVSVLEATRQSVKDYIARTFDNNCKKLLLIQKKPKMNYDEAVTNEKIMQNYIDYKPK